MKMDLLIFELRFIRKLLLAPTTNNVVDLHSNYMDNHLGGMDNNACRSKRNWLSFMGSKRKDKLVNWCSQDVTRAIFHGKQRVKEGYQKVTNSHMSFLMDMMSFFLLAQSAPGDDKIVRTCARICNSLLMQLLVALLWSNKRLECENWIREHLSKLASLRTGTGDTILHLLLSDHVGLLPKEPLTRIMVEEAKMDVNIVNRYRETPLHSLSKYIEFYVSNELTEDQMNVAQLLIENGSHMDAVSAFGKEASYCLSRMVPRWSFNFNLKCLAARSILKHGVRYDKQPASVITFIESHKPGPENVNWFID